MKKTKRKILSLVVAAALLYSALPIPAKAAAFTDVPADAWYVDAVNDLVGQGIIQGTSATTFSPSSQLTRGAFVTMLAKTVLSEGDLKQYEFQGGFKDVSAKHWSNRYVNWASENGVVKGYEDKRFKPDQPVSRQEMAVMVVNFSNATGRKMPISNNGVDFKDQGSIAKYALESVKACQQAGVISGYKEDNTFRPNNVAARAEAASLYSRFLKNCKTGDYTIVRKRVYTTPVRAVEFDPSNYSAGLALGRNVVDGGESPTSLVNRTEAKIAVNAAFFDMNSYIPLGTLINESRVVTVDNRYAPEKSAFVMDNSGNFSIENFSVPYTLSIEREIDAGEETGDEAGGMETIKKVGVNRWPSSPTDSTRIIYTRDWGHTLCFPAKDAVTVDENGVITAVDHDKDVEIPEKGYVLAQRSRRQYEGNFFDSCKTGKTILLETSYEGASTQDIKLSIGAGPRIVKDRQPYGDLNTYSAEGFTDPSIVIYEARRACVGIKPDGTLVILTAYATLPQLAKIMVSFGCTDAINFDGGGSTNLYVDGQWLYGPQERKLNTMLYFK